MTVTMPFPEAAQNRRAGDVGLLRMPARTSGYEVAQILWQTGRRGFPLVALESLLRTPVPGGDGRTLAERLETCGVFAEAGRSHQAAHLEVRGTAQAVRGAIDELTRTLACAQPDPRAVRAAVHHVAGAVERSERNLPARAQRALYREFLGAESPFGEHPEGTAATVRAEGEERIVESLAVLRGGALLSVLFSDAASTDAWVRGLTPLAASGAGGTAGDEPPAPASTGAAGDREANGIREARVPVAGLRGAHVMWGAVAEIGELADHVSAEVAMHGLGGWWQARWQQLFREELGATYGTRTSAHAFRCGSRTYSFTAVGMTLGAVDRARIIDRLRTEASCFVAEGLTESEYRDSAAQLLRAEALHAESARAFCARMVQPLLNGLPPGFHRDRLDYLAREPEPADLHARVRRLVEPSVIVVAEGKED